jgi:3-oxoadipate enol-lactonase
VADAAQNRAAWKIGPGTPERFLPVDGAELHYRDSGSGPAVLFVHGWTLDLEMWAPQVMALEDAYRVIRLDRRGFGRSSGQPSLDRDADDIVALLDHLRIGRVALVGMSQGVRPLLSAAHGLGERVTCLVLDGPPDVAQPAANLVSDGPFAHYATLAQTAGLEVFRREWRAHPLMQLYTADAGTKALLAAMIDRYPGRDLLAAARPAPSRPPAGLADLPAAPTLVICGSQDLPDRVAAARTLADRLPRGELTLVDRAGHLPNLDSADDYNRLVRAFLDQHARTRT